MKILNDLLTKNIGWKLFSLIPAIMVWFIVININNPMETREYTVYLSLMNKDKLTAQNLVVANEIDLSQTKITVKVTGTRLALDSLYSRNIDAIIDLRQFDILYAKDLSEPIRISPQIKLPNTGDTYEVLASSPNYVDVKLERLVSVEKQVQVVKIGDAKDGYASMTPMVTPQYIVITGAESIIEKIDSVRVSVDLKEATEDIGVKQKIQIFDKQDKEIIGLSTDTSDVVIKVPINKYRKVPVKITSQGLPADGFTVSSIQWEPKFVEIVGSKETINRISEIVLPTINMQNLKDSKTYPVDLRALLPTEVSIKNGTPNEVQVKINIERESIKSINIPISKIKLLNLAEGFQCNLMPQTLDVVVKGIGHVVDGLNTDNIDVSINLENVAEGGHSFDLTFNLPEGVQVVSEPKKVVAMIFKQGVEDGDTTTPSTTVPATTTDTATTP